MCTRKKGEVVVVVGVKVEDLMLPYFVASFGAALGLSVGLTITTKPYNRHSRLCKEDSRDGSMIIIFCFHFDCRPKS